MANVINTRIQLKYDSFSNWNTKNPTLLSGEIAIAYVGEAPTKEVNSVTAPQVLFKVGPGAFNSLPWASALAADVYPWAKQSENDFVNTFLALKMTDGTTMQSKLDSVFATDAELAKAISDLRAEIPTKLGVMSIKTEDDEVVILTPTEAKDGDVTITGAHKKYNGANNTTDTNSNATTAGATATIKVPTLTVDEYGHTVMSGETSHTITIPEAVAVNDGELNVEAGAGIVVTYTDPFSANTADDHDLTIAHQAKPTTGTAETATAGSGRTYVTEVLVDGLGHIAGVKTATEVDQVIDWTKVPDYETDLTITDKEDTDTEDIVYAVSDLVEGGTNGHAVTATYSALPTKKYVDEAIAEQVASAVQYLGTVDALAKLSQTAGKGDFYRVAETIVSGETTLAHAGDLLVAEKDAPAQQIDGTNWSVIHGEEGDITEVKAGKNLTGGGSSGSVGLALADTISLTKVSVTATDESGNGLSASLEKNALKLVGGTSAGHQVEFTSDGININKYGNITEISLEGLAQLGEELKVKQTPVADQALSGATVVKGVAQNANGEITVSTRTLTPADIGAQPKGDYKIQQTAVVDPTSEGEAVDFIATIAQDINGNITATKKHVDFSNYVSLVYADGNYKKKQTAYTYTKGAEKIITKIEQNANGEIAVTEGALTTDDIAGGTETWFFYCGTATEVMDTKPTV